MEKIINDQWRFLKCENGSAWEQVRQKSGWEGVDLPHDWLIWQKDLYESADAWYQRELDFSDPLPATCLIRFDGVYMDCDVLLNGEIIISHAYGYTAFTANLSDRIQKRNVLAVHIRHQSPNTRWYSGSGIFRDVTLLTLPENYLIPDSFYLTEREDTDGFFLRIQAEIKETGKSLFCFRIVEPEGSTVAEGEAESKSGNIDVTVRIPDAKPWSPENPQIYKLCWQYGEQTGVRKFGLRTISFDSNSGLMINHQPTKLKGVCLHHDLGALGAAFHEKAARRQLQLMKDMGANALRTSHNPPASKLLDLCDEMGILVVDEAFDMWERPKTTYDYARFFPENEAEDVALWIRRDRCHPCVIMWSVGNEIYDMHADMRGTEVCRMLAKQVRQHDPECHAAITFGCNYMPWEGGQRCAEIVDAVGYNYGENLYEAHHREHPDWVIYGSETASVLSSRGIYHFPIEKSIMSEADLQCSALGNSNTSWGATDLRKMITEDLKCPYSLGQFIWSGIDYIGEPTPYHTRSCYFGQADTACFPKDAYYLFQSLWTEKPVLHIGVNWDWNPGQLIDVPVMTNYSRIELLLNGRSLGIRQADRADAVKCLPIWKVPFEAGDLCARALDENGMILAEAHRKTSGDTATLILTAEEATLLSDGHDLAFVTVSAEDREHLPVENARDRVWISVTGGGRLIGTDNGDSSDPDGYKMNNRRLFSGKLLLIISSNGKKEDVRIIVRNTAGVQAEMILKIRESEIDPGYSQIQSVPLLPPGGEIPIRKIEIRTDEERILNKEHPECAFRWKLLPEGADKRPVSWIVSNDVGIETPFATVRKDGKKIVVRAEGDGKFYLRALGGNADDHPEIISQIEITAEGIGRPALNPYEMISAGLYDVHDGNIGTGNEKGIAFDREAPSMAGFTRIDFGKTGSDVITIPIFALDGKGYDIELFDGDPQKNGRLIQVLHYEKPSIWNVYQEETYRLPVRLTGIHTLCFRMGHKVHMKGFRFEKQSRAYLPQHAADADMIYGDSFIRDVNAVREIGNNVSLVFNDMDFGDAEECLLEIRGSTPQEVNTITIRIAGEEGTCVNEVVNFRGDGGRAQFVPIAVPGKNCTVTFVFLPGSKFDFEGFCFYAKQKEV